MSVLRVRRQLGAIGTFSQPAGSLRCALGIFPHIFPAWRQDLGHLTQLLGRHHGRTLADRASSCEGED
jgi:hypothetical protein